MRRTPEVHNHRWSRQDAAQPLAALPVCLLVKGPCFQQSKCGALNQAGLSRRQLFLRTFAYVPRPGNLVTCVEILLDVA